MTSIFRIATKQAVQEIIEENCVQGRFGLLLTEEGMNTATERLVDLFEMTIHLRSRTQAAFTGSSTEKEESQDENHSQGQQVRQNGFMRPQATLSRNLEHKLPRTRVSLSSSEREKMNSK